MTFPQTLVISLTEERHRNMPPKKPLSRNKWFVSCLNYNMSHGEQIGIPVNPHVRQQKRPRARRGLLFTKALKPVEAWKPNLFGKAQRTQTVSRNVICPRFPVIRQKKRIRENLDFSFYLLLIGKELFHHLAK